MGNVRIPAVSRLLAVLAWFQSVEGNTRGVRSWLKPERDRD